MRFYIENGFLPFADLCEIKKKKKKGVQWESKSDMFLEGIPGEERKKKIIFDVRWRYFI